MPAMRHRHIQRRQPHCACRSCAAWRPRTSSSPRSAGPAGTALQAPHQRHTPRNDRLGHRTISTFLMNTTPLPPCGIPLAPASFQRRALAHQPWCVSCRLHAPTTGAGHMLSSAPEAHLLRVGLRGRRDLLLRGSRVQEHAAQLPERVRARALDLLGRLGALQHLRPRASMRQ